MGFKRDMEDKATGFAFAEGSSAEELLKRIGSDHYEVHFKEDERDVYAYDSNVYKVTVSIELV